MKAAHLFRHLLPGRSGWRALEVAIGQGTEIALDVFECVGERPGPSVLVTAGIHGDEYEGPAAVASVASRLTPQTVKGAVCLIPVANPPAFAAGTRCTPADGVNLARVFPGKESGSPTERLADFLFRHFLAPADCLIDLHSGGVEYEFLPVAGFYGPADSKNPSFRAARQFGLPALWQLPPTPGVLSYEASKAGKIAVGTEYLGAGRLSLEGVSAYVKGIQSCLELWGLAEPSKPKSDPDCKAYSNDWLLAPSTGLFQPQRRLGDGVGRGEELATISNSRGQVVSRLVAAREGVVLGLRSKAYIREGEWAVLLAEELCVEEPT
ncbi:MAG: succinylglutamate desuccinylase/aspartoacylase family protein [Acidobacteriota bacterium]